MARPRRRNIESVVAKSLPLSPPLNRIEGAVIAGIVLVAIALRFAWPDRMAIEHFDEGVYASNIFFSDAEGGQYPYRHLYAPPLMPFLIEWGIIFLGPESIAPFLPALILGTATVPLAWWAVRNWFGPLAGLAAAWLIATSDFHVLYSRTALTDVPVAFFILLAVYFYWEAIRRESLKWSIAAGVATGLAWWTKYTGWLPLAIALSGSIAWLLTEERAAGISLPVRTKNIAACFATMAVVAFIVWSPVLWYLQPYGGYAAVAENHRGYLRTMPWVWNVRELIGSVAVQSGILSTCGTALLPLFALLRGGPGFALIHKWLIAAFASWLIVNVIFDRGPLLPLTFLAAFALITHFLTLEGSAQAQNRSSSPTSLDLAERRDLRHERLAVCLMSVWLVGMVVTTPWYNPYPRLALTWLLAGMLGVSVWAGGQRAVIRRTGWPVTRAEFLAAVTVLLLMFSKAVERAMPVWCRWSTAGWSVPAWQDRTGLSTAAEGLADTIERSGTGGTPTVVYVYASPPTFFHLAARLDARNQAVLPAGNFAFADDPTPHAHVYAVSGIEAEGRTVRREDQAWFAARSRQIRRIAFLPSDLVRLERISPDLLKTPSGAEQYRLSLYQISGGPIEK